MTNISSILAGRKKGTLKNSTISEGGEFILEWYNLLPYKITNKDLERILTDYVENRIKNAKRV